MRWTPTPCSTRSSKCRKFPCEASHGNSSYLGDVATPKDSNYIQSTVVRINGRRQVYVPVYKQRDASTLNVVDAVKESIPDMQSRLTKPDVESQGGHGPVDLRAKVDFGPRSEGVLGAVLCSLVILIFLGQWRMTLIAIITIPLSVLAAIGCLYAMGQTINVMTLAGLALAIGPLVDNAIICLENTHRHMSLGVAPREAAFLGSSEVAMPALVATLCTFLVLTPLMLVPGMGQFLFAPMTYAVFFAMVAAYCFLPDACSVVQRACCSSLMLTEHAAPSRNPFVRDFRAWERLIDGAIAKYLQGLDWALRYR